MIRGLIIGLSIFVSSTAFSAGPKYRHTPNILNDEIENIYNDLKKIPTIDPLTVSTATIGNLIGTTTNNNACAGCVGEYVSSTQGFTAVPGASGAYGDALSLSLTAGDWDVWFSGSIIPSGTMSGNITFGISQTSGNSSTGLVDGDNNVYLNLAATNTTSATVYSRQSLASTTSIYAKVRIQSYSAGTPTIACKLWARRVR